MVRGQNDGGIKNSPSLLGLPEPNEDEMPSVSFNQIDLEEKDEAEAPQSEDESAAE